MSRITLLLIVALLVSSCREEVEPMILTRVPDGYAALARSAFVPITAEGDGAVNASKFSGIAVIPDGEMWPRCGHCERPMQLLLQLDLASLPKHPLGLPEAGLLQVFYCTNSDQDCEVNSDAWDVFNESTARLTRIIPPGTAPRTIVESPVAEAFPPRRITGWKKSPDYPTYEDAQEAGYEWPDDLEPQTVEGDKLLGWPYWAQSPEYPSCPECGKRMTYLFQIDSEENLPYMWGDAGIAHVSFCSDHPERLRFGWACY